MQSRKVATVLRQVVPLWGLEMGEPLGADAALSDMFVTVVVRSQGHLAVVEVEDAKPGQADDTAEFVHRGMVIIGFDQRITGGKYVATVDADADAIRIHGVDNRR